jgi:hypothetical protein
MKIKALRLKNYKIFKELTLKDDELLCKLVTEGDLSGFLWKEGLFKGAGPR